MKSHAVLSTGFGLAAVALAYDMFDSAGYATGDVIRRDIAVIGGGASGTYAAVKLGDMGKSVVLVERKGRLGGQAETYTDPTTGTKVDYGVTAYYNNSVVTDFFARFDIPIVKFSFAPTKPPVFADFAAGTLVANFTPLPLGADYVAQLDKYPYLDTGYYLPDPVPQDLLLTWPEYIEKYSLQDIAQTTLSRAPGSGNPLDILAIYFFTSINQALLQEIAGAAVTTAHKDSSELFQKALAELGTNALLNSTVIAAKRPTNSSGKVKLVVKTPTGLKLIIAKQLVLGIPPILDNMTPFGLDSREHGVLSQPHGYPYYAGLVSNTGLSTNHSYNNVGANTLYHVPTLPGASMLNPTAVDGIFLYWYSGLNPMTQTEVQSSLSASIKGLQQVTGGTTTATPNFLAFADHSPFHLTVSAAGIANGFYRDMYALQGYRNTWYIGALFVLSSGQLWNNTAQMLPDIVAAAN